MRELEIRKYAKLNELAEQGGIVIFGCGEDVAIPIGEVRQAFSVEQKIYNRSFNGLSILDATKVYNEIIAPLAPETILLHLGEADKDFFDENPAEFDKQYRNVISTIKSQNKTCRIAVVSLRNYDHNPQIDEMNRHLKYISDSEQCEYGDIASKKVWNPKATMSAASFFYSIGFVHSLKNRQPIFDLVRMLFCY